MNEEFTSKPVWFVSVVLDILAFSWGDAQSEREKLVG
jgi:hypothetical protein